jgi:hypothetical protein
MATAKDIQPLLTAKSMILKIVGVWLALNLGDTRLHLPQAFPSPEAPLVQAHLGSVRIPA